MSWSTRGLRGQSLEEIVNLTNEAYREKGLALIQKLPTPITPISVDNSTSTINKAYFGQKSTVDYMGVVQGIAVCFDAKETGEARLPIGNIHAHQIEFMEEFEKQQGLAFLLVHFSKSSQYFYLPFERLFPYWQKAQAGGRKSIPISAFETDALLLSSQNRFYIHYLEGINFHLQLRAGDSP